jgi:hypothetical protein
MTGNAPGTLDGYMLISPSAQAPAGQGASPFLTGANQVCVTPLRGVAGTPVNGGTTFTFGGPTLGTASPGVSNWEMTFVAVDGVSGRQWEEDPEFDTGE